LKATKVSQYKKRKDNKRWKTTKGDAAGRGADSSQGQAIFDIPVDDIFVTKT
jgi:hypothetical protein